MPSVRVIVDGLPLADLHCWGRDPDGSWWGLTSWPGPDHMRPRFRSAWFPAERIQRPPGLRPTPRVVALHLPREWGMWPFLWFTDGVRVEHLGPIKDPADLRQPKTAG